jgi:hypothetical protein
MSHIYKTMHARVGLEHLSDILRRVENAIQTNLTLVVDGNYAEASGYARGGLINVKMDLETLRDHYMQADSAEELEAEEEALPEIPEFPTVYGR